MFYCKINKREVERKINIPYKTKNNENMEIISKFNYDDDIFTLAEKEIAKRINGLVFVKKDSRVRIYVDPFRTLPVFIYKQENEILITSAIDSIYDRELTMDKVGVWETILYESSIGKRTIFKEIKQLFAASFVEINLESLDFKIERYWNYSVQENQMINSKEIALKKIDEKLTEIFKRKIDSNKSYLLGVSGGLDSRLTLAYLSKIGFKNLESITYGYKKNILEYDYAKEVAERLGFSIPQFHKLSLKEYNFGKDELSLLTGAQIGMAHVHLYSYLEKNKNKNLLSTYYTDAIFGWATKKDKVKLSFKETQMYKKLCKYKGKMNDKFFHEIEIDIEELFKDFDEKSNFSNLNEYKYLIERNPKFHIYLAYQQERYSEANLIFCDYELLELMLSIPLKFRYEKKLIDSLLKENEYFGDKLAKIKDVSSVFPWGEEYRGTKDFYVFKALNRINALLLILTNGKLQMPNKYLTENLNVLLRRVKKDLDQSVNFLVETKILTENLANEMRKLPIKSSNTGEKYAVITIYNCLKKINKGK